MLYLYGTLLILLSVACLTSSNQLFSRLSLDFKINMHSMGNRIPLS